MTKTLKQRAVTSGRWIIFGHLFSQALRLGSNLVLTRLLVPEMFGVMAVVSVIMSGLAMFSDVGLLRNIVQSKRGEETDYLNTAWTIQIIRGFVVFMIALLASMALYYLGQQGYIPKGAVYANSELPFILAVVSMGAVISGFNSINLLLLNRKLMLGKLTLINIVSQVGTIAFILTWAWYQRDIWALVYGGLFGSLIRVALSHILNLGERCHFFWDREAVKEIIHFGKWIFISSILGFLLNQGDRLLLGGLISPEELGIYTVAFFLANALKSVLIKLIVSVFFPVLSETIRKAPENLERIYYKIRSKVDAITFFVAGFIFSTGDVIVACLYDTRYQEAGWMLEILSISLISTGSLLIGQCFLAQGKSKIVTGFIFVQTVVFYATLPFLFFEFGILGAVWSVVIAAMVRMVISSIYMKIYFFYNIKKELMMLPLIFLGYYMGVIGKDFL